MHTENTSFNVGDIVEPVEGGAPMTVFAEFSEGRKKASRQVRKRRAIATRNQVECHLLSDKEPHSSMSEEQSDLMKELSDLDDRSMFEADCAWFDDNHQLEIIPYRWGALKCIAKCKTTPDGRSRFDVNDIVQLNSGGPKMMVQGNEPFGDMELVSVGRELGVRCEWSDKKGKSHQRTFPLPALFMLNEPHR